MISVRPSISGAEQRSGTEPGIQRNNVPRQRRMMSASQTHGVSAKGCCAGSRIGFRLRCTRPGVARALLPSFRGRVSLVSPPPERGGRVGGRTGRDVPIANASLPAIGPPPQPSPFQGEGADRRCRSGSRQALAASLGRMTIIAVPRLSPVASRAIWLANSC